MNGDQLLAVVGTVLGVVNAAALAWRTLEESRKLRADKDKVSSDADKVDAEAAHAHAQASAQISSASGSMIELMRQRLQEITADLAQSNAHRETLIQRVDAMQSEIVQIRANHIRDLSALQTRHDAELADMRAEYTAQIDDLRLRHKRQNDGVKRLIHQMHSHNLQPVWTPEE